MAVRNVWSKKVRVLLIFRLMMGMLVSIKSILEDCEMIPFLNHVCSILLAFLARSVKLCSSIR